MCTAGGSVDPGAVVDKYEQRLSPIKLAKDYESDIRNITSDYRKNDRVSVMDPLYGYKWQKRKTRDAQIEAQKNASDAVLKIESDRIAAAAEEANKANQSLVENARRKRAQRGRLSSADEINVLSTGGNIASSSVLASGG